MLKILRNNGFWLLVILVGACSPTDQSCSGPVDVCAGKDPGQICTLGQDERGQCLPDKAGGEGLHCYAIEEDPTPVP